MSTTSSEGMSAAGLGSGSSTRRIPTSSSPSEATADSAAGRPDPEAGTAARGSGGTETAATQAIQAGDQTRASQARATTTQQTAQSGQRRTARKGPRRVRLAVARVDPWSVMKMSFLLSVAAGIAGVVLTAVLWMILSTMNVFNDVEGVLQSLQTATSNPFSIKDYVGFGRVVSLSIVIGVIDVILMTAIATVFAFLYNICSALVGGIQLTLTDD
ncbi:MAG: DUF3566 domain-containing protein [Intrasporangium sp.]|uniref:DUF3566 domain-containing protein n=1 Tax=Intrasporangium sp. TaxID=1925024 RepID=UPI003F7F6E07